MNKQLKVIDQFTRRIDNDVHTYVIETYWILEDLSVILDSQEHPARWIYDRQEVRSKPVNLSDCPSEVKRLIDKAIIKRSRMYHHKRQREQAF